MDTKTCTQCKEDLPTSSFDIRKPQGTYKSWCKRCNSLRNMQRSYGISIADYDRMLEEQEHHCALCGISEEDAPKRGNVHRTFCVDHDHKTGKVRGLLCHNCNVMLGHANDNVEVLLSAVEYLTFHKG